MNFLSFVIFPFLALSHSTAFSMDVDFENLGNCYNWTNFHPQTKKSLPTSFFADDHMKIEETQKTHFAVNALLFQEKLATGGVKLHVIQKEKSKTYAFGSQDIKNCLHDGRPTIIPVNGQCHGHSDCSMANLKIGIGEEVIAGKGRLSQICPPKVTRDDVSHGHLSSGDLTDRQAADLTRKALNERLQFLLDHLTDPIDTTIAQNILLAAKPQGACYKVFPELNPDTHALLGRLVCRISQKPSDGCLITDGNILQPTDKDLGTQEPATQ